MTLHQVAAEADVSIKTVSRVLNNEPHVRADKRERVERAIEKLGFRRNVTARQLKLKGNQSFLIGLLHDNPSANYISHLVIGTLDRCNEFGYRLSVEGVASERDDPTAVRLPHLLTRDDLDGVIVTPPVCDDMQLISSLEKAGHTLVRITPFVEPDRTPRVFMDDERAAYEITKHLISLGHRRIAHITGSTEHGSSAVRLRGFQQAMNEAGLRVTKGRVLQGDFTFKSALACADTLLSGERRPTAIFAANDEMAAAVLYRAERYGLSVPYDLSLAGFDDIPLARILEPQITTIRQPLEPLAHAAANLLIRIKEGRADDADIGHEVPFELIERGSSGPARH